MECGKGGGFGSLNSSPHSSDSDEVSVKKCFLVNFIMNKQATRIITTIHAERNVLNRCDPQTVVRRLQNKLGKIPTPWA